VTVVAGTAGAVTVVTGGRAIGGDDTAGAGRGGARRMVAALDGGIVVSLSLEVCARTGPDASVTPSTTATIWSRWNVDGAMIIGTATGRNNRVFQWQRDAS